jgi:hypothetical protein
VVKALAASSAIHGFADHIAVVPWSDYTAVTFAS